MQLHDIVLTSLFFARLFINVVLTLVGISLTSMVIRNRAYLSISFILDTKLSRYPGFDPELLAMIPRPVQAMIFLFPITEAYEKFKDEEEAHLLKCEQSISPDVVFFKQTISNACGMMALLHSVASSDDEIVGK